MRYSWCIFLLLSLCLSCESDRRERVNVRLQATRLLPSVSNTLETFVFFIRDVPTFYDENVRANGFSEMEVDEVISSKATLSFPFLSGENNLVDEISVRIFNKEDPDDWKEMYYWDLFNVNTTNNIDLLGTIGNLHSIISKGQMDIEVRINFRQIVPPGTRMDLDFSYNIFLKN